MFFNHKKRAVQLPKSENDDDEKNSSHSEGEPWGDMVRMKTTMPPKLDRPASMTSRNHLERAFEKLIGYQVESQLDQKLILGLISNPSERKKVKKVKK